MADPRSPDSAVELVRSISKRLQAASDAALVAQVLAEAGDADRALNMLRDIEPPLYEATMLLNAASMVRGDHAR